MISHLVLRSARRRSRVLLRRYISLLIVLGATVPGMAAASTCQHGVSDSGLLNQLGTVYGSTAIGTRITGYGSNSGYFGPLSNPGNTCILTATITDTAGGAPGQNNIFATNVPGIGIGLRMAESLNTTPNYAGGANISNTPKLQASATLSDPGEYSYVVLGADLYRIPGDLPAPGKYPITSLTLKYQTSDGGSWVIPNQLAITIKANCTVNGSDVQVTFPTASRSDFSGMGSIGRASNMPIPISLTCSNPNPFPVTAYLTPAAGSTLLQASHGVIGVTGVDNLGIQILGVDGSTPFSFDAAHPTLLGNFSAGTQNLNLKAQLIQTGSNPPTLGDFVAGATLTLIFP